MKNKKIYILIICLAVILTGCSFDLGKKVVKPVVPAIKNVENNTATTSKQIAMTTESIATTTEKLSSSSAAIVGDFKKYTNTTYGFELTIPLTYLIEEKFGPAYSFKEDVRYIRFYHPSVEMLYKPAKETSYTKIEGGEIYVYLTENNFKEYLKVVEENNHAPEFTEKNNVDYSKKINGISAILLSFSGFMTETGDDSQELFINGRNGYNFIFRKGDGNIFAAEENVIISTFKFIK
jgi:hypothetical protein